MRQENDAGAIILAGGKNIRMGTEKAFLRIEQKTIIRYILDELQKEFHDILIVSKEETCFEETGVRVITDIYPGCGPLGGLHAGLTYSLKYYNLVVACDLPFINEKLARILVEEARGEDVLVPQKNDEHLQPLCAVYSKNCIKAIEESLNAGNRKVTGFYSKVKVKYINEDKLSRLVGRSNLFFNVNTPEELALARRIALDGINEPNVLPDSGNLKKFAEDNGIHCLDRR